LFSVLINLYLKKMEENKNNAPEEKGGGLGPVLIISALLVGGLIVLKLIIG
jgi:hypothetical protein